MPVAFLIQLIRRCFGTSENAITTQGGSRTLPVRRAQRRTPKLVQLEDRRVFNASFVFSPTTGLALTGFDSNSLLTISQQGNDLHFELSGATTNTWSGTDVNSVVGNGSSLLSISRNEFTAVAKDIVITDAVATNLDVTIEDSFELPSGLAGQFQINVSGDLQIAFNNTGSPNDTLDPYGYQLAFVAGGDIHINGDIDGATDASTINLQAGGNVVLDGSVNAQTSVDIIAGDAIIDDNGTDTNITASTVTLTANNGIGSADSLEINAGSLSATNSTSGSISITEVASGNDLSILSMVTALAM